MEYIEWNLERINEFLEDKFKRRGVDATEYELLTKYLKSINPDVLIDVGCFFGVSTYILGTSIPDLKHLYAIENIDNDNFSPYSTVPKSDYGKFIPKETIFATHGYGIDLPKILQKHNDDLTFVFLDAVKQVVRVLDELKICYDNKVDYVGIHDTSRWYKFPRKAMKRAIQLGWYELVDEINTENIGKKTKGVSILKLVE